MEQSQHLPTGLLWRWFEIIHVKQLASIFSATFAFYILSLYCKSLEESNCAQFPSASQAPSSVSGPGRHLPLWVNCNIGHASSPQPPCPIVKPRETYLTRLRTHVSYFWLTTAIEFQAWLLWSSRMKSVLILKITQKREKQLIKTQMKSHCSTMCQSLVISKLI